MYLEREDIRQFTIDLPKVGLALWMELRSKMPNNELPKYKKGEFLYGLDVCILENVLDYLVSDLPGCVFIDGRVPR